MKHISKTTALTAVEECFTYARTMRRAAAVTGPAGCGKTTALTTIAERDPDATLIHVGAHRSTPRAFVSLIADAMEFAMMGRDSTWRMMEIIESHLRYPHKIPQLYMFDEAQNIPVAFLKEVLDWPERFGVPVLVCGNERMLKRTRAADAAFDQIDSRVAKRIFLGKPPREDFENIAIDFDVFGVDGRNACAAYGAETSIRDLVALLEAAKGLAAGGKITLDTIRQATVSTMGHCALKRLSPKRAA